MSRALLKSLLDQVRSISNAALTEDRDLTKAEQAKADELLKHAKTLRERVEADEDLRKQIADLSGDIYPVGAGAGLSRKAAGAWGQAVLKSLGGEYQFKSLVPSGTVTVPSLSSTIAANPDRPQSLLDLIPSVQLVGGDAFAYFKETVRTFNAAPVAPGGLKPTSVLSVVKVEDRVRVIAHLSEPIPRQWLSDAPMLEGYVNGSMRQGVILALENEVLNADGTGEHFVGLNSTSGIQTQAFATDRLLTLRKCITLLELVNLEPSGIALHPTDWEAVETLADNEANYILAGPGAEVPVDRARRRLWGIPVAISTLVTVGVGWVADFAGSTELEEREQVEVSWSESVYDTVAAATDYARNMLRFRAEGRWGLKVGRPAGVVKCAFS